MERAMHWGNKKEAFMPVNSTVTSPRSTIRTGEIEPLKFFAQRRACDDRVVK